MALDADTWSAEVFDAFLPEFQTRVIYGGRTTDQAIRGSLSANRQAALFSLDEDYEGSVWVKDKTFPRDIEAGGTVTVDRKEYRVITTFIDALQGVLRIDFGNIYAV